MPGGAATWAQRCVDATFDCGVLGASRNILVEWSAVTGADRYEVLRSTTSGSGYAVVQTVTAPTTSWADTNIANGTTYYYVVRATAGTWVSAFSAEATATTQGLICT